MSGGRRRPYDHDGGSGYERNKRRRVSAPLNVEDRLESLITRVGEKSTSPLESNLEGLASVLEADLPNFKNRILQILCTCVTNLPEKISIYSTLVGLLNEKNFEFGGEFLIMVTKNLQDVLAKQQFERARLMVRFICDLINCNFLVAASLMTFLELFVQTAAEGDGPQARSDWFIYTVLTCLPWCGKELSTKKSKEVEKLLEEIEVYIKKRDKLHVKALRVWSTDDPHPQEESLDCLWTQVTKMKDEGWTEKIIRRPYLAFHSALCKALPHQIPTFKIPPHTSTTVYPLPSVVFRMFDYTDVPESSPLPGAHTIERFLLEESIRKILEAHYKDRKECASQLLDFPQKNKVPLEYVITEVIFAEMFRLPNSPQVQLFYGSLIIELCKVQPASIPGVIAQGVELLFERLDSMNITCVDRFINWFTYHISNFQFKWSWDDWISFAGEDSSPAKRRFIIETICKCIRASYYQAIHDILPVEMKGLVQSSALGNFRFEGDKQDEPGNETVKKLIEGIKTKKGNDELIEILQEIPPDTLSNPSRDITGAVVGDHGNLQIEVFVLTVLRAGMKSISHTYNALTTFHPVFKSLITSEDAQLHCLKAVYEFWMKNHLMLLVVIDKLIKLQIIECSAVVNWIFSKRMAPEFTRYYIWEAMHDTLKKMIKHKKGKVKGYARPLQIKKELVASKEELERENRSPRSNGEEQEDPKVQDTKAKVEQKPQEIEELTSKLERAQRDQKQLFLILFQRFIIALTEHAVQCEQQQTSKVNPWFRYTLQRLQEIFLTYNEEIVHYEETLQSLLFTDDIEPNIIQVFKRFKSLRS